MRQVNNLFKLSVFPINIVTLLAFTIISCATSAQDKSSNTNFLTKSGGFLHLDGIYQAAWGNPEWIYLRFYPHGKVLFMASNVNSPGKDMLNEKWREPRSPVVKKGDYQVTNSKIELNFGFIKEPWKGRIHSDTITFYFTDESGQKEHERTFWYTKGPEYAQRPEPLKQLEERKKEILALEYSKARKAGFKEIQDKKPQKINKYEWYLIYKDQSLIYLRYVGIQDSKHSFQSSEKPFKENNPTFPMPKKYCLGTGAIGETVTMGQKTTFYHPTSKKQLGTVNKVFLKFEVVSYNKAQNSVTIRLLEIIP